MVKRAFIQLPFAMARRLPDESPEAASAIALAGDHGLWCGVFLRTRSRGERGRFSPVSDAIRYRVWLMNQWTGNDGIVRPMAPAFVGYGKSPEDAVRDALPSALTPHKHAGAVFVLARTGESC